jgi:hypothetical protein
MSSPEAASFTPPPSAEPAPLSEVGRMVGVFTSPKTTFTDIVARPRWYAPVILLCVVGLCFVFLLSQRVGFERIVQQSLDQNPKTQNMPAEQRAQSIKMGTTIGSVFGFVAAVAFPPISVVVVGGVLMFIANSMLGSKLRFGQMCAIAAYAFLVNVVSTILTAIVMLIRSPEDFDVRNPLAFNVGAFLNPDSTAKWLLSLATSLDVFAFWTMALIAIGLMAATRKLTFGKAFVAVLIPWAILVVIKAGFSAITG